MDEEIKDESESLNDDEGFQEEKSEAEIRAEKAEKKAQDQELRAKKAEQELKALKDKPQEKETPKNDYSLNDIRALNDVHDDDVSEITDFAKYKGISIAEAKKHPTISVYLKNRAEERKTAEATNTGGGRKGTSRTTDDDLLEKVNKGEELSDDEMTRAAKARIAQKKKK